MVFDLDGTLLEFGGEYADVIYGALESDLGVRDEAFAGAYSERFFELLEVQAAEPYRRAFEHAIEVGEYDEAAVDASALVETLREREYAFMEPPADAEGVIADLHGQGYAVGVLTNGVTTWQREKLAANGLLEPVDAFVASYEVGAHKPAGEAFAFFEERLPADSYVMVGDSLEADVEGAQSADWRGVHYDPSGESTAATSVSSFAAIPDLLRASR